MLRLHRAERSNTLADALSDILAAPLSDPFAREIVAVPAKGVERWLIQRLSTRLGTTEGDGIAANIAFPSPTRLADTAVSATLGHDVDDDPWAPARVVWAILDVIDSSLGEPWCAVLAKHLGGGNGTHRAGRRYSTAAHLTELYRSYGSQRPALLIEWSAGANTDGAGGPLASDLVWQAELWRRVRAKIVSPSPAERLVDTCERLRTSPDLVDLPERLSLFGPTRLPADQLAILDALGANREVHLWLPHSSPGMWSTLTDRQPVRHRRDDDSALSVSHPLLASLARDSREMQLRLADLDTVDVHHRGDTAPPSLLGRLQNDIRNDCTPTLSSSPDRTIEVHSCHGPARQVEVLRESLLHAFEDDPTLEPRDVLVMCPDVETYAPLVRAAFGQGVLGHPGHRLRVRLADRALHQTNPLLAVISRLLDLAAGRVTASQVLDLLATAPLRARFHLSDDELERLREWTQASGARWGIGQRQREAFGLGDFRQNTFNTALDRILLGAAADESENAWLDLALPLDDVDGNDIDLAGRFAEFVDRLAVTLRDLQGCKAATEWARVLVRALDLLTEVSATDAWQSAQAHRELAAATDHGGSSELVLSDVRAMLANRLAGRPTRANFRTGELTVCTMVPMRSVPHRVVVLLGLDDDVFPRGASVDGDNVLSRDPCVGERDPRSEDRQLLLDAVMSAGDRLLLFYTGADPVTGATKPPAIPLSELLDVVRTTVGESAMTSIETRHPLQPFDRRNFVAAQPFSFDHSALDGARATQIPPVAAPPFLAGSLEPRAVADINLLDLEAYLVHPTRAFLRQRLGLRIPEADDDVADSLDTDLGGLARWDLGDRMLESRLAGTDAAAFRAAEWRRGTLPPFKLGARELEDIERVVDILAAAAEPVHVGDAETYDIAVDLGSGRRLTGTVTGVHGHTVARTFYSRLAAKHRLSAWVRLLALAASAGPAPWRAVTTGRGQFGRPAWRSTIVAPDDALAQLRALVDLYDRGLREALPIATDTSAVYADRRARGADSDGALDAAGKEWSGRFGERSDRILAFVHGQSPRLERLTADTPRSDETAWAEDPTRFGVLASRLWTPLLAAERIGQP